MWFIPVLISILLFICSFFLIKGGTIIQFLLFIISALIVHFTDSLWVTYIYVLLVVFAWFMFAKKRKILLSDPAYLFDEAGQKAMIFANIVIPIYQTINWALLFVIYALNK